MDAGVRMLPTRLDHCCCSLLLFVVDGSESLFVSLCKSAWRLALELEREKERQVEI